MKRALAVLTAAGVAALASLAARPDVTQASIFTKTGD